MNDSVQKEERRSIQDFLDRNGWAFPALVVLLMCAATVVGAYYLSKGGSLTIRGPQKPPPTQVVSHTTIIKEKLVYIQRYAVNDIIEHYMESGRSDQVYSFYNRYTGSRNITLLILTAAISQNIPVNLLFAVAQKESQYNPNALNPYDHNGTFDIGLFQVNTGTFRGYTRKQLFSPPTNVRLATVYLRHLYDKYDSWVKALCVYNGGTVDGVKDQVLTYLSDTLRIESQLNEQFVAAF